MKAIILAAGEGTRLRPHTRSRPKCLVELGGKPLLSYQLAALRGAGVNDITVVTGYLREQIEAYGLATRSAFDAAYNPRYDSTNMVASLMCASDLLDGCDDVLIVYADIVYEPRVAAAIAACPAAFSTTVDRSWRRLWRLRLEDPLSDAETMKLNGEGNIVELGKRPASYDDIQGQYMGLVKVRADFAPELVRIYQELDPSGPYDGKDRDNIYMTSFLQYLIDHVQPLRAVLIDGGWLEVDTTRDLEIYNQLRETGTLDEYCRLDAMSQVDRA